MAVVEAVAKTVEVTVGVAIERQLHAVLIESQAINAKSGGRSAQLLGTLIVGWALVVE
jgi:hypothetical protein